MNCLVTIQRLMIKMLFESYYKPGNTTVIESEFIEFMKTAIPVFHLEKIFQADDESVKKISLPFIYLLFYYCIIIF